MWPRSFDTLLAQLGQLSPEQRDAVLLAMQDIGRKDQVVTTIETARADRLCCPRCHSHARHRHGRANGLQRYRCRACGRTYNALTGTPLARLRYKAKWLDYCDSMLDPAATVRRSAGRVGVHKDTSFRWRHRMLTWIRTDRQLPLCGIVEADEMYLLESEKGARQLARLAAPFPRCRHALPGQLLRLALGHRPSADQ